MAIRRAIEGRKDRRLDKFVGSIKGKRGRTWAEILLKREVPLNGDNGHRLWWVFRINFMDPWKIHFRSLSDSFSLLRRKPLEFPLLQLIGVDAAGSADAYHLHPHVFLEFRITGEDFDDRRHRYGVTEGVGLGDGILCHVVTQRWCLKRVYCLELLTREIKVNQQYVQIYIYIFFLICRVYISTVYIIEFIDYSVCINIFMIYIYIHIAERLSHGLWMCETWPAIHGWMFEIG